MKERDTRKDIMIIQDCKNVAFGEMLDYAETAEQYNMKLKVTKGTLLVGTHRTELLRPYNVLTDGLPVSLS